ncbi:MAG: hypothetical protein KAQ97_05980 [Candidatus Fermentibacteraceae bacterium]|nr:hypothetical protein [Candidatus Fermentibacteraceae bacterium]
MEAAVISLVLMTGSLNQTGLPLEDPLNKWIYMFETVASEMLPGTFPVTDAEELFAEIVSKDELEGIGRFIYERSLPPGNLPGKNSFKLAAQGTIAGEILHSEDALETRCGATGRIFVDILPSLFMDERLSIWTGSDEKPPDYFTPFHEGAEPGRHLYVDWGYLRWNHETISISFGRIPQRWGPGRFTQLIISDNSPPLDMLKVGFSLWNILEFTGFISTVNSDSGTYLTSHRLDIKPLPNLRVGLSESILFKASGLDFAYMNPVIPWYPVQWNERVDDNAFLAFDAAWKPLNGVETYGELLIDDIQYENTHNRPNKLAWTAGISTFLPSLQLGTVAEYTRIDRYVYSQREPRNYYLHDGSIIGSGLGPDADRITLSVGTPALWPLLASITLDHTRHGEGTVQEGWPDSVQTGGSFPSGIVEYSTGTEFHLSWYPVDFLEAHGIVKNTWIRNQNHVSGENGSNLTSSLELIWTW